MTDYAALLVAIETKWNHEGWFDGSELDARAHGIVLVWAPSWERGGRIAEWPEQAVRILKYSP